MRCPNRTSLIAFAPLVATMLLGGCQKSRMVEVPGEEGALKTTAKVRSVRRAYDGAPPVISHIDMGADCSGCHSAPGVAMRGVGYAPPSPHEGTAAEATTIRCRQCHVSGVSDDLFVDNAFVGLPQNMRSGGRLNPISPPTIPHRISMRENCMACHAGPAARQEIATTHPERTRCRQCHLEESNRSVFVSDLGADLTGNDDKQAETGNN